MREIPEDIWKKAGEVWVDLPREGAGIAAIANALYSERTTERERCYEIAKDKALQWSFAKHEHLDHGCHAALDIARAIRSPAVLPAGDRAVGGISSLPPTANGEG